MHFREIHETYEWLDVRYSRYNTHHLSFPFASEHWVRYPQSITIYFAHGPHFSFSTFQTNLLTIPSSVAGMLTMFLITLLSESVNDRTWVASTENMWALPFLVAIYTLRDEPNQWIFFVHPLFLCTSAGLIYHRDWFLGCSPTRES